MIEPGRAFKWAVSIKLAGLSFSQRGSMVPSQSDRPWYLPMLVGPNFPAFFDLFFSCIIPQECYTVSKSSP
jgi:hypothetical protein